jgi:hypothetical protein
MTEPHGRAVFIDESWPLRTFVLANQKLHATNRKLHTGPTANQKLHTRRSWPTLSIKPSRTVDGSFHSVAIAKCCRLSFRLNISCPEEEKEEKQRERRSPVVVAPVYSFPSAESTDFCAKAIMPSELVPGRRSIWPR